MGLRLAEQHVGNSKNVTFVLLLNRAQVQALNTAHVLHLNKRDVLALNKEHVLSLNAKICAVFTANTKSSVGPQDKRPKSRHAPNIEFSACKRCD